MFHHFVDQQHDLDLLSNNCEYPLKKTKKLKFQKKSCKEKLTLT